MSLVPLPNLYGHTCYINTLIQCIDACTVFHNYVRINTFCLNKQPLLFRLKTLCLSDKPHIIHHYKHLIKLFTDMFNDHFTIIQDNDIHEFFFIFLQAITQETINPTLTVDNLKKKDDSLFSSILNIDSSFPFNKKLSNLAYKCNEHWYKCLHDELSPLNDIFYGQFINQIMCGYCKHIHHTYELFRSIEVEIVDNDLHKSLEAFFNDNILNSHDNISTTSWKCDSCNRSVHSKKCIKLFRLPKVFTIVLKRFSFSNNRLSKNMNPITVPKNVDFDKFSIYNIFSKNTVYQFRSTGNHFGNLNGGHYTASKKSPFDNQYYTVDDDTISKISEDSIHCPRVPTSKPYMLFYEVLEK